MRTTKYLFHGLLAACLLMMQLSMPNFEYQDAASYSKILYYVPNLNLSTAHATVQCEVSDGANTMTFEVADQATCDQMKENVKTDAEVEEENQAAADQQQASAENLEQYLNDGELGDNTVLWAAKAVNFIVFVALLYLSVWMGMTCKGGRPAERGSEAAASQPTGIARSADGANMYDQCPTTFILGMIGAIGVLVAEITNLITYRDNQEHLTYRAGNIKLCNQIVASGKLTSEQINNPDSITIESDDGVIRRDDNNNDRVENADDALGGENAICESTEPDESTEDPDDTITFKHYCLETYYGANSIDDPNFDAARFYKKECGPYRAIKAMRDDYDGQVTAIHIRLIGYAFAGVFYLINTIWELVVHIKYQFWLTDDLAAYKSAEALHTTCTNQVTIIANPKIQSPEPATKAEGLAIQAQGNLECAACKAGALGRQAVILDRKGWLNKVGGDTCELTEKENADQQAFVAGQEINTMKLFKICSSNSLGNVPREQIEAAQNAALGGASSLGLNMSPTVGSVTVTVPTAGHGALDINPFLGGMTQAVLGNLADTSTDAETIRRTCEHNPASDFGSRFAFTAPTPTLPGVMVCGARGEEIATYRNILWGLTFNRKADGGCGTTGCTACTMWDSQAELSMPAAMVEPSGCGKDIGEVYAQGPYSPMPEAQKFSLYESVRDIPLREMTEAQVFNKITDFLFPSAHAENTGAAGNEGVWLNAILFGAFTIGAIIMAVAMGMNEVYNYLVKPLQRFIIWGIMLVLTGINIIMLNEARAEIERRRDLLDGILAGSKLLDGTDIVGNDAALGADERCYDGCVGAGVCSPSTCACSDGCIEAGSCDANQCAPPSGEGVDMCANVTCDEGQSCDAGDGICKETGASTSTTPDEPSTVTCWNGSVVESESECPYDADDNSDTTDCRTNAGCAIIQAANPNRTYECSGGQCQLATGTRGSIDNILKQDFGATPQLYSRIRKVKGEKQPSIEFLNKALKKFEEKNLKNHDDKNLMTRIEYAILDKLVGRLFAQGQGSGSISLTEAFPCISVKGKCQKLPVNNIMQGISSLPIPNSAKKGVGKSLTAANNIFGKKDISRSDMTTMLSAGVHFDSLMKVKEKMEKKADQVNKQTAEMVVSEGQRLMASGQLAPAEQQLVQNAVANVRKTQPLEKVRKSVFSKFKKAVYDGLAKAGFTEEALSKAGTGMKLTPAMKLKSGGFGGLGLPRGGAKEVLDEVEESEVDVAAAKVEKKTEATVVTQRTDLIDKNLNIKMNDIVKTEEVDLFQIISNRYRKVGTRLDR